MENVCQRCKAKYQVHDDNRPSTVTSISVSQSNNNLNNKNNESNQNDTYMNILKILKFFKKISRYINQFIVRTSFLFFSFYYIFYVVCIYGNNGYFGLFALSAIIVVDLLFVTIKRHGYDTYWFSISVACFLVTMLILIHAEVEFHFMVNDVNCVTQRTNLSYYGRCVYFVNNINICEVTEDMVFFLVTFLCFARWFMPHHKKMTTEEKYMQTYTFTIAAADAIEIGDLMYNKEFEEHKLITAIQIAFSLGLIQFCFSLVATKNRNYQSKGARKFVDIMFATEAWSLLLVMLTQEIPSFVVRILLLKASAHELSGLLLFFTIKNFLMTVLLFYRSCILMKEEYTKSANESTEPHS